AVKTIKERQSNVIEDQVVAPPMAEGEFSTPSSTPQIAPVTKEAIAKITCPNPLSPSDWLVELSQNQIAKLDLADKKLSSTDQQAIINSYNKNNINLAGHFHLASWSCGNNCQRAAIINTNNGRLIAFGSSDDLEASGWSFTPTSSLLIINPNSQDKQKPTIYALVEDQGLRRICYLTTKATSN
ncbi:MAG TPA: hypothetical protein PKN62_00520, partial [bacterium]|nr:hypothetical protein [bacterium]